MYRKNCVQDDCGFFFFGGGGIVLSENVDNLALYIKMCKVETSKLQNA